jgi:hypothetical protein
VATASCPGSRRFQALLAEWRLLVDGENPIARTNVAPVDEMDLRGVARELSL